MTELTFEGANRLQWSDDLMTTVVRMQLLLNVYLQRTEAEPFRVKKRELETKYGSAIAQIPGLYIRVFQALNLGHLLETREQMNRAMTRLQYACVLAFVITLPIFLTKKRKELQYLIPLAVLAYNTCLFLGKNSIHESIPGGWKLLFKKPPGPGVIVSSFRVAKVFKEFPLEIGEYLRDLADLCYQAGWIGPIPKEQIGVPTLDGLLGPIFPKSEPHQFLGERRVYEWELISMSGDEHRREFGVEDARKAQNYLKESEYERAPKFRERDFNMLFDRLYLCLSIEDIVERYPINDNEQDKWDISTIQRNTAELAKQLGLDLPEAKHKKPVKH